MSLQWTFVATFLYLEIFLVVLLLLPFISATRWQKVFKSRLLDTFRSYANLYFNIFIVVLIILFLDSVRDVKRYSETHDEQGDSLKNNPNAEAVMHMKLFRAQRNFYIAGFALFLFLSGRRYSGLWLFLNGVAPAVLLYRVDSVRDMSKYSALRSTSGGGAGVETMRVTYDMKMFRAQRNFYIAGFAVFLWLVLRRLVVLIAYAAQMEADVVATRKQAESASAVAKNLMEDSDNKANETKGEKVAEDLKKELQQTKKQLEVSQSELTAATKNLEAMRKQAESTNREYDRLTKECSTLQNRLYVLEGKDGKEEPKKDA